MKCLNHEISESEEERDHHCYPVCYVIPTLVIDCYWLHKIQMRASCEIGYNFSVTLAKCMVEIHVKHNQMFSLD